MKETDFRTTRSKRDKFFDGAGTPSGEATPTRHNVPKPLKVLQVMGSNVIDSAHYGYVYSMAMLPCSLEGAPGEDTSREDVLLVTGSGDETVKVVKMRLLFNEPANKKCTVVELYPNRPYPCAYI